MSDLNNNKQIVLVPSSLSGTDLLVSLPLRDDAISKFLSQ
jgi:hypothetical protein